VAGRVGRDKQKEAGKEEYIGLESWGGGKTNKAEKALNIEWVGRYSLETELQI